MDIKKIGVIGFPIAHSKSPIIHNYFIQKYNISAEYRAIEVANDINLKEFVSQARLEKWIGFNITIPHKQSIINYLDSLDQSVQLIQACNTVVFKDNKLHGFNTDAEGFYYPIKNNTFTNAIVLGNGGASRAVIYQLAKSEIQKIYLVARDHQKSNDFTKSIEEFFKIEIERVSFQDDGSKFLVDNSLVINSTSVGMRESDEIFKLINHLGKGHIFYDLIYNPWETKMMRICKENGCRVINGSYMLAHQGALAFNLFFNKLPETEVMYNLLLKERNRD